MMIYSPSFLYPDNISIDADNDNIFTWESAGDPQTDYQLFIRKVSDNTEIYNSTKLTFGSESHTVPSSTLTNGVDYMWMVKVWCDATTYAESEWVFFKANTTPTLVIDNIGESFTHTDTTKVDFEAGDLDGVVVDDGVELYQHTQGTLIKEIDISTEAEVETTKIEWTATTPAGTSITIETALSLDGGESYGEWQTATNGNAIPGITAETDLSNARLKYRATLETEDTSVTPKLTSISLKLELENLIEYQNYNFTATYTQAEGIPIKKFKFVLYDDLDIMVYESDWMYNTDIEYFITGMINGNSYQIECHVENQYGQVVISDKVAFTVSYEMPDDIPELIITRLDSIGAIKLEWTNIKQVLPVVTGNYSYVSSKFLKGLQLDDGSVITYSEELPEKFTIVFWIKLPTDFVGSFLTLSDGEGSEFEIGYNGTKFYYQHDYRLTAGLPRVLPNPATEFKVGVKQNKIIIQTDTYTEILR